MNTLKDRLSNVMKEKGLSAYKLSKLTGISQSTIGRLLKDEPNPNESTIATISHELGIRKEWLSHGTGAKEEKNTPPNTEELHTVGQRVDYIRKDKNLSYQKLGDIIGAKESAVRMAVQGNNLRDVYLVAISGSLGVRLEWLKTGRGAVYEMQVVKQGVPFYDVPFDAQMDPATENILESEPTDFVHFPNVKEVDFWARVAGRSMEDKIMQGDIVALKRIDPDEWKDFIRFGSIYAIQTKNIRTIKIIEEGSSPDLIRLVPVNPDFREQEMPKKVIQELYKVTGRAQMMSLD